MKKNVCAMLIAASLATLSTTSVHAGLYDGLYVFGDSLSDVGNVLAITGQTVPASPPYFQGRFSNGPNYADVLASGLGLPLTSSVAGGTGYAYGGARSDYGHPALGLLGAKSFVEQIGAYKASTGNVADANGLYVLWIGSNDMSDVVAGSHPAGSAAAAIANTLGDLTTSITDLASIGAQHFLVPNLPNLGLAPSALAFGVGAQVSALTQAYNATLDIALNNFSSLNLYRYDAFSTSTDIASNPSN